MKSNDNTVLSVFVSVYSPISGSILVNVFEFFPPNTLGGDFFHQTNFEVLETKSGCMDSFWVHGQRWVFPFFISETTSVVICSFMGFLDSPFKVAIFLFLESALPQVDYNLRFWVDWDACFIGPPLGEGPIRYPLYVCLSVCMYVTALTP